MQNHRPYFAINPFRFLTPKTLIFVSDNVHYRKIKAEVDDVTALIIALQNAA